jgi:hypothetical protein
MKPPVTTWSGEKMQLLPVKVLPQSEVANIWMKSPGRGLKKLSFSRVCGNLLGAVRNVSATHFK